ncbi:OmpA family protein [Nevskia sp.]|uniref:OmpA family protein n=1 Tax=Nevskia sp. TaxID=1929292 RepID=UPI0025DD0D3B|nr:OmpA family protein [Nevskia sp.]
MALSAADDYRGYYFAGFANYELADPARDSDDGYGFQATIGRALGVNNALELSYLNQRRDRGGLGGKDYKHVLSLDYVRDFGLRQFQSGLLPDFKPYLLGSIGGVLEDVQGDSHLHPALNLGAGLLFPLRIGFWDWGWGLRTEVKGLVQYNDRKSEPANNAFLADAHFQIGLSIPLVWNPRRPVTLPPPRECQLSVVDPVTGRRDCINDADRDGVPDSSDACPATPNGDRVDAKGCSLEKGRDADADGVLDNDDQCPGTAAGLMVDAKGCAIEQTLSLQAVTFESDSAVLTGAATGVLDGIATTLGGQANVSLDIGGHTDDTASDAYNLALSKQRAEAVRQYLIARGIDGARLSTQGYGEAQPLVANDSDANRALNRRVDFKLVLAP